jgi:hypothetical protein
MRTSLKNIKTIDDFYMGILAPEEAVLFQANVLLNPNLAEDLQLHMNTHAAIRDYSRQVLKKEIEAAGDKFFNAAQYQGMLAYVRSLFLPK